MPVLRFSAPIVLAEPASSIKLWRSFKLVLVVAILEPISIVSVISLLKAVTIMGRSRMASFDSGLVSV